MAVFYGLERAAKESRQRQRSAGKGDLTGVGVFGLHIGSFAAYNFLTGYLLVHRQEPGVQSLFFFFFAMTLHFLVNDFGLWEHHKGDYDRVDRWVLAVTVIAV